MAKMKKEEKEVKEKKEKVKKEEVKKEKPKKEKVKKEKPKKEKHILGKGEFIFNFISLVCMIGMGIYFGYRSLYYYSKQNYQYQEEAQTLNGYIMQHTPVIYEEGDGLHHDSLGYYFKGNVENNYVSFANRMFRVIRINEDNTVKLVLNGNAAIFPWGDPVHFNDSNLYYWLNKTDWEYSGYYYYTLPSVEDFLVKTEYKENILNEGEITESEKSYREYITLLGINDYVQANGMSSYLKTGRMFFLLGLNNEEKNLYVEEDGSIQTCETTQGFGIRPVITLKANTVISGGDGTKDNPYVISQENKTNMVASYVKIGEDIWRVFYQNGDDLKLHLNGYIQENGAEKLTFYSQTNSIYDIMDAENIGYYLNNQYFSTLPSQNIFQPFVSLVGEISDDKGYQYVTIYGEAVQSNVSLLNVFDPFFNEDLTDFFRVNNTSPVGSMEYVTYANGLLGEADVREEKHIVPVVSIKMESIKSGTGSLNDPYLVG